MSKHNKGSNGNSRAIPSSASTASPVSYSSSPTLLSSTFDLVEVLDSYGIDLTAMLLLFWCLVAFIVVFSVNLYLTFTKRQQRLQSEHNNESNKTNRFSNFTKEDPIQAKSFSSQHNSARVTNSGGQMPSDREVDATLWINKVIDWLTQSTDTSPTIINECIDAWMASLNNKSKKLIAENGMYVEFARLYRDQSTPVKLVDVKVENEFNDNILTTLKAICDRLVIQVRVSSGRDLSTGQSSTYEIVLEKFSALLKVVCKPEDSLFVARFLERPETKVNINGPLTSSEKTYSSDLIINGVLNILTSTLVDLNFCYATNFPKFHSRTLSSLDGSLGIPNDIQSRKLLERKLFVTIVKADNLAVNQSKEGHEVYCTIEINEPKEKRKTSSVRKDTTSPVWQDHFLFGLNDKSREILFEVFDGYRTKGSPTKNDLFNENADECIGFGIANILELKLNPSEKLVIPLQTRYTEKDASGGTLEIELLLMEHKLATPSTSSCGELDDTERTVYPKLASELNSINFRDLSQNTSQFDQYARSSLNTVKSDENGLSSEGYGTDRGVTPDASMEMPMPLVRPELRTSQPREPRSLIRTIRKRLSFSKRSKSVERQPSSFRERSVTSQEDERARSVPGSREPSAPREMANGRKQESFLSLASNTSFFSENSTLVMECSVNGEKKHYIVPYSKANKRKYRRRKGTKLHVFNDHLFVAQHVPSSMNCQVCGKSFAMRIGKQGYQCRECGFLSHKQCHVNADSFCPANGASRLNFELEASDTPRQVPSPVPEVRVIAPSEPPSQTNEKEI